MNMCIQVYRCSGADMHQLKAKQDVLNTQYSSSIKTEFAFNGAGILEKVNKQNCAGLDTWHRG